MNFTKLDSLVLMRKGVNGFQDTFYVDLTKSELDPEHVCYLVTFHDVGPSTAWSDSFYETFDSLERAREFIRGYIYSNDLCIATD